MTSTRTLVPALAALTLLVPVAGAGDPSGGEIEPIQECRADIDGDGRVGFTDLHEILASWGSCRDYDFDETHICRPDIYGDGFIGSNDLLIVLAEWGPCSLVTLP